MAGVFATALGMLLCRGAYATPAADAASAVALADAPLYGYFAEARGADFLLTQRTVDWDETRDRAHDPAYVSRGGEATLSKGLASSIVRVPAHVGAPAPRYYPVGAAPRFSAPLEASLSEPLARLDCVCLSDLQVSSDQARRNEREVLLRSSDASVRAKLRVTLGKEWLFVYGDMGPAGSALRYQGLVGIRLGHGANLLGGWRRVTYYYSPNSLDFEGPFLSAQRSW